MKHHTFSVACSFTVQYTFTDSEVTADVEGGEDDIVPTASALAALQAGLETILSEAYAVSSLTVDAESDDLLGTAAMSRP